MYELKKISVGVAAAVACMISMAPPVLADALDLVVQAPGGGNSGGKGVTGAKDRAARPFPCIVV